MCGLDCGSRFVACLYMHILISCFRTFLASYVIVRISLRPYNVVVIHACVRSTSYVRTTSCARITSCIRASSCSYTLVSKTPHYIFSCSRFPSLLSPCFLFYPPHQFFECLVPRLDGRARSEHVGIARSAPACSCCAGLACTCQVIPLVDGFVLVSVMLPFCDDFRLRRAFIY